MAQITPTLTPRHPLPGSAEAADLGCVCSVSDNHKGVGTDGGYWLVVDRCPVHAKPREEENSIEYLRVALMQLEVERDRYFNMKRVNAGLYAHARQQVQRARAILLLGEAQPTDLIDEALEVLEGRPKLDLHLHYLLDRYRERLQLERVDDMPSNVRKDLDHVISMCVLTQDWFDRGESDKANRWLGFIQGFMYQMEVYTIDQLRDHMRGELP